MTNQAIKYFLISPDNDLAAPVDLLLSIVTFHLKVSTAAAVGEPQNVCSSLPISLQFDLRNDF